jgi:hypothetical protein
MMPTRFRAFTMSDSARAAEVPAAEIDYQKWRDRTLSPTARHASVPLASIATASVRRAALHDVNKSGPSGKIFSRHSTIQRRFGEKFLHLV